MEAEIPRRTEAEIRIYWLGVLNGMWQFAWWKDGVQYVGTSGATYEGMVTSCTRELEAELAKLREEKGDGVADANPSQKSKP